MPSPRQALAAGVLFVAGFALGVGVTRGAPAATAPEDGDVVTAASTDEEPVSADTGDEEPAAAAEAQDVAPPPEQEPAEQAPARTAPAGTVFEEDFSDGDWQQRITTALYHRDDVVVGPTSWLASHRPTGPDDACTGPDEKRTVTRGSRDEGFNDEWVYRCAPGGDRDKAHLMTAIGSTSGYSIGSFTPNLVFTDVTEVRWAQNVNPQVLSSRQFTEVAVLRADGVDAQNLPCGRDLPCGTDDLRSGEGVIATLTNGRTGITTGDPATTFTNSPRNEALCAEGSADSACAGERVRVPMSFVDNGDGTITFSVEMSDGTRSHTVPGSFPDGPVRVLFKDHTYTPGKIGAEDFTWHWDDIEIR